MVLRQECTLTRNYDNDGENCKIMQWAALLGAISTTFLDNNNNNNNNSLLIHKIKNYILCYKTSSF